MTIFPFPGPARRGGWQKYRPQAELWLFHPDRVGAQKCRRYGHKCSKNSLKLYCFRQYVDHCASNVISWECKTLACLVESLHIKFWGHGTQQKFTKKSQFQIIVFHALVLCSILKSMCRNVDVMVTNSDKIHKKYLVYRTKSLCVYLCIYFFWNKFNYYPL